MTAQISPFKPVAVGLATLLTVCADLAAAQVLTLDRVAGRVDLVTVTVPLADATTVAWPTADGGVETRTSGSLTLVADLESAFAAGHGGAGPAPATPAVVVSVGQATPDELGPLLARLVGAGVPAPPPPAVDAPPADGAVRRRLGPAGSVASVRLEIALPAAADWLRTPAEVLWSLVPELLDGMVVATRVDGERAVLETRTEAELADLTVRRLRTALARIAERPDLDDERVRRAAGNLGVQRRAVVGDHPDGAERVLGAWLRGGPDGVRQLLFGAEAVTLGTVETAARRWLADRPGEAVVSIPPQVLNPRFARPPVRTQLDNDLAVAVLERPGVGFGALTLRPVLTPDVDGAVAATVLARVATELRSSAPGSVAWVRVAGDPARLEAAAPAEGFGELLEALQGALSRIAEDSTALAPGDGDARRRALSLLGVLLGLAGDPAVVPAALLRPDNLALGLVAEDRETVLEALRKFGFGGPARPPAATAGTSERTRVAARGERSTVAVALPLDPALDAEARAAVLAELLEARVPEVAPGLDVETLRPFVPGRTVVVLVVSRDGALDRLEEELAAVWTAWLAPGSEEELAGIRRRVAASVAAEGSGVVGRSRLCAGVAAGGRPWREPAELEMAVLTVSAPELETDLASWRRLDALVTAGAGVLPIEPLP